MMANSLWIGFRPLTGISLIFYGHIPNDSSSQCSGFRPLTGISLIFRRPVAVKVEQPKVSVPLRGLVLSLQSQKLYNDLLQFPSPYGD